MKASTAITEEAAAAQETISIDNTLEPRRIKKNLNIK